MPSIELARTGMDVLSEIAEEAEGSPKNGWTMHRGLGHYGTHYAQRALIVWLGFGANLDADAVYPHATTDVDGKPLTGAKKYVLHFEKDELPPVEGFWSLTMMNERQFFVDNPIDRYAIGDRSDLVFADDGSLDIYLQHESPGGEKERNWLAGSVRRLQRLSAPVLAEGCSAVGIVDCARYSRSKYSRSRLKVPSLRTRRAQLGISRAFRWAERSQESYDLSVLPCLKSC